MKKVLALIMSWILLSFTGCAIGHNISYRKLVNSAKKLGIGMNQEQVMEIMGKPNKTEAKKEKKHIWEAWIYEDPRFRVVKNNLGLLFKNKELLGWEYLPERNPDVEEFYRNYRAGMAASAAASSQQQQQWQQWDNNAKLDYLYTEELNRQNRVK